jgi:hypothetical protein
MQQAPPSWPQHRHPGQSLAYGTAPPPYGTPAPGYGIAAPGGYRAGRRPGAVTAAAVMAFVLGGVIILINLFALLLIPRGTHDATYAWLGVLGVVRVALGAVFIWGGIAALKGRTRKVLVVVSVIEAIFSLLLIPLLVLTIWFMMFAFHAFLEFIFVLTILILILQPQCRDFFRARGETTN